MLRSLLAGGAALLFTVSAAADMSAFETGPVIAGHGPVAPVAYGAALPEGAQFKIAFDIGEAAQQGQVNRRIESAARLINMHARAGLPPEATAVALVVHGGAAMDLVTSERLGADNASAALIAALVEAGVRIELCGQTAAARDIAPGDLLPGVEMSLSAMTAHALLQQNGYTLNPF